MIIRVINKFHNQDFTVIPNGNLTLTKYKRYVRRACSQRDCECETKVYMRIYNSEEADLVIPKFMGTMKEYWKLIDPVDLELRDRGYGVKL